jgi:hypothetical protein
MALCGRRGGCDEFGWDFARPTLHAMSVSREASRKLIVRCHGVALWASSVVATPKTVIGKKEQDLLELQRSDLARKARYETCHLPRPKRVARRSYCTTFRLAIVLSQPPGGIRCAPDVGARVASDGSEEITSI